MSTGPSTSSQRQGPWSLHRLRERGVLRVAASYAVIAWLLLQVADVTLEPLGAPPWAMMALIIAAAAGFPIALAMAWFLEIGADGVHVDAAPAGVARPQARGLRHYADVIVIGALLVAVAVLLVRQSDLGRPKPPANPAIAVLPFENLSGDPEQEYFSDGLAEEMLDRLGRVPGLRVIARSSSFGFKGKDVDARTIAEKLGVTTLLEGSVRRDGQRLKLSARLIDGATGQQVWSGSFDREFNDVFAVQGELAAAVVGAIVPAAKGSTAESAAAPTSDLNAYDLYLASKGQLVLRTPGAIRKSVELAEQAVRLDPKFARGQAQFANALLFRAAVLEEELDQSEMDALLRRAESAVHQALALDPELSEAHGAYANLLRNTSRPGAEEAYKRALELNPNNAATWHDYAVYVGSVPGRGDESVRATHRALELDPRQPTTWANYLLGFGHDPRDPRYRAAFERALRMVGDMPFAIDRFTLPELSTPGFPVEVMKAAAIKQRAPSVDNLPVWINRYRAWLAVDPLRAQGALPASANSARHDDAVDMEYVRLLIDADIAGILGDWGRVDRNVELLRARDVQGSARVDSVAAFWHAMQGRYDEAAGELARAEPIPERWIPPVLGVDATYGLMESAQVRIYRATGRKAEAAQLAARLLGRFRTERAAVGDGCTLEGDRYGNWMRYASLAANEGLKDEAVDGLAGAMRCGELPPAFQPWLPWFRELDGYAPYEELKRERDRRVVRIRDELIRIERESGLATTSAAGSTPGRSPASANGSGAGAADPRLADPVTDSRQSTGADPLNPAFTATPGPASLAPNTTRVLPESFMRRILVAIDGSEDALRALDFAVKVALFKPPAELHILTVQAPADSNKAWEIYVTPERIHQVATERSNAILDAAAKHLENSGCAYALETLEGEAAATIAARAAQLECESIVMGTHGRGQLGILLLGSVAQRVVHHATVPVTLVK